MVTRNFLVLLFVLLGVGCTPQCEKNNFEPGKPYSKAIPELKIEELERGSGDEVEEGKLIEIQYRGWLYDSNKRDHKGASIFDTYKDKSPLSINYGKDEILEGWQEGLKGMRKGGKRRLFIPSDMGYGEAGAGTLIPKRADLLFEIELISIQSGSTEDSKK